MVKLVLDMLQRFGIATVILMVTGYWVAGHVVDPLVSSYNKSIEVQSKVLTDQADNLTQIRKFEDDQAKLMVKYQTALEAKVANEQQAFELVIKNQTQLIEEHQQQLCDHKKFMEKLSIPQSP